MTDEPGPSRIGPDRRGRSVPPTPVTGVGPRNPIIATRRFVLGTAIAGAAVANAAHLLRAPTADPYAGGRVLDGEGVRTTVLDPTDPVFGAVGDGIVLGDLVAQAGSTTVSSATAPFTSTERDRDKLVVWRGVGDEVATGIIESVRSPTEAVLRSAAAASSQRDGGPNTNAAVGTDNTAALNAAFRAAQAATASVAPERRRQVPTTEVHLPRGVFLTRALDPFEQAGVTVSGEGRFSTILASVDDGAWMQLSPFDADPSDAFQGNAFDWTFRDIQFLNPAFGNTSSEGRRTGRAVQDNGSGGTRIISCSFIGLSYGFCGAHGSDFSEIREAVFSNCDVGFYFGPGSQQLEITKTDATQCREGAVFEGAPHWHIGGASSFEDPSVSAITIEAKASGRTRLGVPVDVGGAFYSGKFLIDQAAWFETNSGGNGRTCPRMIWVRGESPFEIPVEGVVVRDAYVIAGGDQVPDAGTAFLELETARASPEAVVIESLVMGGDYFNAVFRNSGTADTSSPRLVAIAAPDSVALTAGPAAGAKILLRDGSSRAALRMAAPAAEQTPLRLVARSGQGATPLLSTGPAASDGDVSGIAGGGALLDAFRAERSAGGEVEIDANTCNYFSCSISGSTALRIVNPPRGPSQRLVVEVVADGQDRAVTWPSDCRFAAGDPPGRVRASTRTSVTFSWHPSAALWIETARAVDVPA
ncbi:hypothetical protein [Amnibacterium endophyticum]|uniref:Pectate lyase superfamily protein domain-containing protein n=1 Tax=Amnibacterium endophyticum TaxID=2109337 RepID=A0ABW4LBC8_9MICO